VLKFKIAGVFPKKDKDNKVKTLAILLGNKIPTLALLCNNGFSLLANNKVPINNFL